MVGGEPNIANHSLPLEPTGALFGDSFESIVSRRITALSSLAVTTCSMATVIESLARKLPLFRMGERQISRNVTHNYNRSLKG